LDPAGGVALRGPFAPPLLLVGGVFLLARVSGFARRAVVLLAAGAGVACAYDSSPHV
jgi:hypothetical protein